MLNKTIYYISLSKPDQQNNINSKKKLSTMIHNLKCIRFFKQTPFFLLNNKIFTFNIILLIYMHYIFWSYSYYFLI